ncbi:retention module-containing protein [Candidatus Pseudomonas adelgestsugas]|uniref:LapA adhesin domain-containing protein n=1 Tax=Candidatus Pseudomonas adelgestsugas TaxID=1302376 RepID=A0ABX5R7H9_9PSED|nr:retention module-containing protein [Candidatus Pseudomonas adelgestsugas]QAX81503.1 hypothetical protein C3B55_00134 [Candidatus Pseudomonas adelgestsugas]
MSSVVAIVKSIVGQVFIISPEGTRRILVEGDRLFAGDEIYTGISGAASLELFDGRTLDLGHETQWSADLPNSSRNLATTAKHAAPSASELQQATSSGIDPTTNLEAVTLDPAVINDNGTAGGGHSGFVVLDPTASQVDPTIGFQTNQLNQNTLTITQLTDTQGSSDTNGSTLLQASTLTLDATPTITEAGGTINYTATLTHPSSNNLDIILSNGAVITINAGQLNSTISIPLMLYDSPYIDHSQISANISSITGGNNLMLTVDSNPAITHITNTIDTTTVTLTAPPEVNENDQITYTATLSNKAITDVMLKLDNGSIITIKAGETTGTLTMPASSDDVFIYEHTQTVKIIDTTGGNFEKLVVAGNGVTTKINDTIDMVNIILTATNSVNEGDTIVHTATLADKSGNTVTNLTNPLTVTLDNSQSITIGVNQSSGTVTTIAPNNSHKSNQTVTTAIKNVTGGEHFENLVPITTPVNTTIISKHSTADTTIVKMPPVIDLDANNTSGAKDADYKTIFTEDAAEHSVSIADTNIKITDPDSTMLTGATVILTNAQTGDTLNVANSISGISSSTDNQINKITLTFSGSSTLAEYMQQIQNIKFTNSSHDPSTIQRLITVSVTDGDSYSNVATTTINVIAVNDSPVTTGGVVIGIEDTPLIFAWDNFNVTDVDSQQSNLGVKIIDLPMAGKLQYLAAHDDTWTMVTAGQTFTKAQIDDGQVRFMPGVNESGIDSYGGIGVGNRQADYARFKFQPTDSMKLGNSSTITIDITPIADAPAINVTNNHTNSEGLIKQSWHHIARLRTNTPANLKKDIDNASAPNSTMIISNVESNANIAPSTDTKISGLIYMEAGKVYTFSGIADDSLVINIDGKDVISGIQSVDNGEFKGTFTPTNSGYCSLNIYYTNQSGPGHYDVNMSINGNQVHDLSTSYAPLYTNVTNQSNAGVHASDPHSESNVNDHYIGYTLNKGSENDIVQLSKVTAELTDTDGSETLSVKISGVPIDSVLTDSAGHSFTATKDLDEVNVTGWDLSALIVKLAANYDDQFNLTVSSTSTENPIRPGNDIFIGSSSADTFIWNDGDYGNDIIKEFNTSDGDCIDLRDLLKGETDSTIDNYLKIITVDGVSTLQISSEGKLNASDSIANDDVTIKLEGNDWSHTSINSLISGADPTIKIDHTA